MPPFRYGLEAVGLDRVIPLVGCEDRIDENPQRSTRCHRCVWNWPTDGGSCVDAVFKPVEMALYELDAYWRRQKIDGTTLIEPDCRAIEPLFGFLVRAKDVSRFR